MDKATIPRRAVFLLCSSLILASDASGTELKRHAFAGGATTASSDVYALAGTVGEAGPVGLASGDECTVGLGFWSRFHPLTVVAVPPGFKEVFANALGQNTPNPFNVETTVSFSVAQDSPLTLAVYDVTGRRIAVTANAMFRPGAYSYSWRGEDERGERVANGVYFSRLTIGSWSATSKM